MYKTKNNPNNPYLFEQILKNENSNNETHMFRSYLSDQIKKSSLKGKQTAHGIRSLIRQFCQITNVQDNIAETMLSHSIGNRTEVAYKRYEYLEERRTIMQQIHNKISHLNDDFKEFFVQK